MSVPISAENIVLNIKKGFVILVPGYTATRLKLAAEYLLLLFYSFFFPNVLNCSKQTSGLLFYVGP